MYEYTAETNTADGATWTTTTGTETLTATVPEDFGGDGRGASPEHQYAASLLNCYIATFKVIADKSNLSYSDLHGEITVRLDPERRPPLQHAEITISYEADSPDKAQRIAEKAEEHCYIHQSVETDVTVKTP